MAVYPNKTVLSNLEKRRCESLSDMLSQFIRYDLSFFLFFKKITVVYVHDTYFDRVYAKMLSVD